MKADTKHKIDWLIWGRRAGNIMIPLGYVVLLNFDLLTGIIIRLIANVIIMPWAIRSKMWDFCALLGFLMSIEVHKLITLFFFS